MLRIRLQRTGRKRNPTFRVVVADKARSAKGKVIEVVGYYLPAQGEPVFEIKEDRITHWIGNGAIPTDTLARLLAKKGMKDMEKYMEKYVHKKKRKASEEEEAAPAAEAPASDSDAPAEEKPADEPPKEDATAEPDEAKEEPQKEDAPAEAEKADDTEKKED